MVGIAGESGSGKTITALSLFGLLPNGARVTGSIRLDGTELLALRRQAAAGRPRPPDRHGVPGPVHLAAPDLADRHPAHRAHAHHLGVSQVRGAHRGRRNCWTRCVSPTRSRRCAPTRGSSPAACGSGSRSRSRWPPSRGCWWPTSRPPPSTSPCRPGILRLLDRLCRERGLAVIVITHDLGVMSATARRLYVMYAGRLAEAGPTSRLLTRPAAPLHPGAARRAAASRGGPGRAGPDRRQPAVARRRAGGCPFHPRCAYARPSCAEPTRPDPANG